MAGFIRRRARGRLGASKQGPGTTNKASTNSHVGNFLAATVLGPCLTCAGSACVVASVENLKKILKRFRGFHVPWASLLRAWRVCRGAHGCRLGASPHASIPEVGPKVCRERALLRLESRVVRSASWTQAFEPRQQRRNELLQ